MNRAPKGLRRAADRYLTPDPLAAFLVGLTPEIEGARRVLEPSCGDGAFLAALVASGYRGELVGLDLEPGLRALRRRPGAPSSCRWAEERWTVHVGDYLGTNRVGDGYDVVIGNPPYSHAEAFVRRSLEVVRPGGLVAFLLRLSFLESSARLGLWSGGELARVHVLAERPSFTGDGRTNSAAYAWFVWVRGPTRRAEIEVVSWRGGRP